MICPDCDGRGEYLDAPQNVLDGRTYWERCATCEGTGRTNVRPSTDEYFLQMLQLVAIRSTCGRRAVGAIIVDARNRILGTGHNGVPTRFRHCTEEACDGRFDPPGDTTRCLAVHAELNALLNATRLDLARTLYCSCTPCFQCAKVIVNTSIDRIVVLEEYVESEGHRVLVRAGIPVVVHALKTGI